MRLGERCHGGARLMLAKPRNLPSHMRGPIVELYALRTALNRRGQGDAAALMLETTAEADIHRKMLFLHVDPAAGIDRDRLTTFYARNGFLPTQAEPLLMVRPHIGMKATPS